MRLRDEIRKKLQRLKVILKLISGNIPYEESGSSPEAKKKLQQTKKEAREYLKKQGYKSKSAFPRILIREKQGMTDSENRSCREVSRKSRKKISRMTDEYIDIDTNNDD